MKMYRDAVIRCHIHGDATLEFIAEPDMPRTHLLVSSVRLGNLSNPAHTLLRFWTRGRSTGQWVVVRSEDAFAVAARLLCVDLKVLVDSVDVQRLAAVFLHPSEVVESETET